MHPNPNVRHLPIPIPYSLCLSRSAHARVMCASGTGNTLLAKHKGGKAIGSLLWRTAVANMH